MGLLVLVGHTWKTLCFFVMLLGLPPFSKPMTSKCLGLLPLKNIVMWSATKDRGHGTWVFDLAPVWAAILCELPQGNTPAGNVIPATPRIWCYLSTKPWDPSHETFVGRYSWYGSVSKPWYLVNPKIAGKWMFIPLKMVLIGIDPDPYDNMVMIVKSTSMYDPSPISREKNKIWRFPKMGEPPNHPFK